jgi:hypothetical protein
MARMVSEHFNFQDAPICRETFVQDQDEVEDILSATVPSA